MSGFAGYVFTRPGQNPHALLESIGTAFAGPNYDVHVYCNEDVGIVVSSRFTQRSWTSSFAEIFESKRYLIACEGYVVNLAELPCASGAVRSQPRAQLIVRLFERVGRAIFAKLNGGYNMLVWDKLARVCTIQTSKYGQRILYTTRHNSGLAFASEIKLLPRLTGMSLSLDYETVRMNFFDGGVRGSRTSFQGVDKLLPGTSIALSGDDIREFRPSTIPHPIPDGGRPRRKRFYLEQLDCLMQASVSRLAAVNASRSLMIGSGVDSSLVAAYLKRVCGEITAVTHGMPGDWDESADARRIAGALGCDHRILPYRPEEAELLSDSHMFVDVVEEPAYWNQLGPPLMHSLRSVDHLPGAIFLGAEADLLFNYHRGAGRSLHTIIANGLAGVTAAYLLRRFINRYTKHAFVVPSDFDLLNRNLMGRVVAVDGAGGRHHEVLRSDYSHLAPGPNPLRHFLNVGWQNIRIISRIAQYHGAEALFPYLDDDLVSFLLSVPDEFKVNKHLLRVLLRRFLPASLVPRKKRGYWADTVRWHHQRGLLAPALDLLAEPQALDRPLYNKPELRRLIERYRAGAVSPEWHPIFWQLLLFELFCRRFVDSSRSAAMRC